MQLGQLADFFADVMNRSGEVGRLVAFEGAVCRQRTVQLAQQPLIVDDEAKLLLSAAVFIQPVHTRNCLQEVVLLQGLADVKHRVPRCIEAGEEL